jgi:hypothetical protein
MLERSATTICSLWHTFGLPVSRYHAFRDPAPSATEAAHRVIYFDSRSWRSECEAIDGNRPHSSQLCGTGLFGFHLDVMMRHAAYETS